MERALTATETLKNLIVDSGATCLMYYTEDLFVDITELKELQKITVGDGYSIEAVEKGIVELFIKVSDDEIKRQFSEVLYVPNLSYNL